MTKPPYGGRWQLINERRLGEGGQSEVFRVRDVTGELEGEYALKRVLNRARRERFRREVEAIKRLTDPTNRAAHPNIITLIDHSVLDDTADEDKQFLVMPIAQGGDLSVPGRLALYKGSIDAVVQVATQIASALHVAHEANIIHRDVKPANILFTGNGHEIWLSDFGICLIRESRRITDTPEIVGPSGFMAPELEEGGRLDVTRAADIYSLGKVIYYMISDGAILPRERLNEPQFSEIFNKGQRYHLLRMLLGRMICPVEQRLSEAAQVLNELKKIEEWEKNAELIPMSEAARDAARSLQRMSLEKGRVAAENAQARSEEASIREMVQRSATDSLTVGLNNLVPAIASASIVCTVADAAIPNNARVIRTGHNSVYRIMNGVELVIDDVNDRSVHALQLFLCEHNRAVVQISFGAQSRVPAPNPPQDAAFAIVGICRQALRHRPPNQPWQLGYLSRPELVGTPRGRVQLPGRDRPVHRPVHRSYVVQRIMAEFNPDVSLHIDFLASEWPLEEGSIGG